MYRLKIERDDDAQNPRTDHDNADIMFCKHGRYTLGDDGADDPMIEVNYAELAGYRLESALDSDGYGRDDAPELNWESVEAMLADHYYQLRNEAEAIDDLDPRADALDSDVKRAEAGFLYLSRATLHTEYRPKADIAIIRPLSLYDHSGITIFAGRPTCQWDSGQVGWQYITIDTLTAEWNGDEAKALAYMDATLKTYDDYIRGNVFGFTLEAGTMGETTYTDGTTEPAVKWEHEDSCWGFIGDWHGKDDPTGMGDHLPAEVMELFDSMDYNDEGEWRYTADVPEEAQE